MMKMAQATAVRPDNPYEVFQFDQQPDLNEVRLTIRPVVFNVPERAGRPEANLYIVVKGWLTFEEVDRGQLKTKTFGTEIGYFRAKRGALEHVFGIHYDMDEEKPGHPVFHAQLGSLSEFKARISETFRVDGELSDQMNKVLRNVRIPSAQMDVFSVITQICADHLIGAAVPDQLAKEVLIAFASLRKSCDFLTGAAHRLEFLSKPSASECYRSTHWYDSPLTQSKVTA
jgi:hypothetical protein